MSSRTISLLAVLFMLSSIFHNALTRQSAGAKSLMQQEAEKSGQVITPGAQLPAIPGAVTEEQQQGTAQQAAPGQSTEEAAPAAQPKEEQK